MDWWFLYHRHSFLDFIIVFVLSVLLVLFFNKFDTNILVFFSFLIKSYRKSIVCLKWSSGLYHSHSVAVSFNHSIVFVLSVLLFSFVNMAPLTPRVFSGKASDNVDLWVAEAKRALVAAELDSAMLPEPAKKDSTTASYTRSATQSATQSATASYTESATQSATQSATASYTESATASFTESATASYTESATASYTLSP